MSIQNTTQNSAQEYLLLFRGTYNEKDIAPEELQQSLNQWQAWFNGLIEQGKCKGGQPLKPEGCTVSGPRGETVTDGPFAETKELVGGYFLLTVSGLEEAVEIARQCPGLRHGLQVEVRPVAECCPVQARLNERLAAGATA